MNVRRSLLRSYFNRSKHMFLIVQLLLIQHVHFSLARLVGAGATIYDVEDQLQQQSQERQQQNVQVSDNIPPLEDALELVRLSNLVYDFREKGATNCSSFPEIYDDFTQKEKSPSYDHYPNSQIILPKDADDTFKCHLYERDSQDTQVLIVSRQSSTTQDKDYVAIVFAGTDDIRNCLTDGNILTKPFGPEEYDDDDQIDTNRTYNFPPLSDNIRVHAGFNNAVFKHGLFDRIYDQIKAFKADNPNTRILTTGHSLGASDAVLTAVALKLQDPFLEEDIHSINFGCPKVGTRKWREFVNGMDGLGIWRVVNGLDLVPRLPGVRFHHVGHTFQLDSDAARGYWLHEGDKSLGYVGVPFGWNTLPYVLAPKAAYSHLMSHYTSYLQDKSRNDPETHYINGFETVGESEEDEINFAKEYSWLDDDEKRKIARQYLEDYQSYVDLEHYRVPELDSTLFETQVN